MPRILLVADVPWVVNAVRAALGTPGYELMETSEPATAASLARRHGVDAVVADLQVGSMGGLAVTREVRAHYGLAGDDPPPVVMLLDRAADGFLARRAGAGGWVVKPFAAIQLREALAAATMVPAAVPDGDTRPAEPTEG